MPELQSSIPPAIQLGTIMDRTTTIRASISDVEVTLVIAVLLVIAVVLLIFNIVTGRGARL